MAASDSVISEANSIQFQFLSGRNWKARKSSHTPSMVMNMASSVTNAHSTGNGFHTMKIPMKMESSDDNVDHQCILDLIVRNNWKPPVSSRMIPKSSSAFNAVALGIAA